MIAKQLLLSIAVILVIVAVADDLRRRDQLTAARKTYLLVAAIFAIMSAVLQCS